MDNETLEILNDICWALSNLNDRVVALERGDNGCGFTESNWDSINEIMDKVGALQSKNISEDKNE